MKVIVTPHRHAYLRYCRDNNLNPTKNIFLNNTKKLYGLELNKNQIVLAHEWYKVDDDIKARIQERIRTHND